MAKPPRTTILLFSHGGLYEKPMRGLKYPLLSSIWYGAPPGPLGNVRPPSVLKVEGLIVNVTSLSIFESADVTLTPEAVFAAVGLKPLSVRPNFSPNGVPTS